MVRPLWQNESAFGRPEVSGHLVARLRIGLLLFVAILLQTAVGSDLRVSGVAPDLMVLLAILGGNEAAFLKSTPPQPRWVLDDLIGAGECDEFAGAAIMRHLALRIEQPLRIAAAVLDVQPAIDDQPAVLVGLAGARHENGLLRHRSGGSENRRNYAGRSQIP